MTPQLHEDLGCTLPDYRAPEQPTSWEDRATQPAVSFIRPALIQQGW